MPPMIYHYATFYDKDDVITLFNFKECKTSYKYTENYNSDSQGRLLKKKTNPVIVIATSWNDAAAQIKALHLKKLQDDIERYRKTIESRLRIYGDEIVALHTSGTLKFILRDGTIAYGHQLTVSDEEEKPLFYVSCPSKIARDTRKILIQEMTDKILSNFKKDFNLVFSYDTEIFYGEIPPKENIRLVKRNQFSLWPKINLHVIDNNSDRWYTKGNHISMEMFLKLPVTYRRLLNEFNHEISENKKLPDAAIAAYDIRYNVAEDTRFYYFYQEDETTVGYKSHSSLSMKQEFDFAVKNAELKIILPSTEIFISRDFLFNFIQVSRDGILSCSHCKILHTLLQNLSESKVYILKEIKSQLTGGDWQAFLLLNEMEDFTV